MLMALRVEPSRFFLKGKVTQKQTSYKHKHTIREEVSQVWNEHKRRRYKKQSQALALWHTKEIKEWIEVPASIMLEEMIMKSKRK